MQCRDRPTPARVRVDPLPAVATEADSIGHAMAASITDNAALGGRRYEHGEVVRTRLGADVAHLTPPDSTTESSLTIPSGELYAAHIASGATSVDAQTFTTAVMTESARRLARGEAKPGAYTPGAAFGPELVVTAGGEFIRSDQ